MAEDAATLSRWICTFFFQWTALWIWWLEVLHPLFWRGAFGSKNTLSFGNSVVRMATTLFTPQDHRAWLDLMGCEFHLLLLFHGRFLSISCLLLPFFLQADFWVFDVLLASNDHVQPLIPDKVEHLIILNLLLSVGIIKLIHIDVEVCGDWPCGPLLQLLDLFIKLNVLLSNLLDLLIEEMTLLQKPLVVFADGKKLSFFLLQLLLNLLCSLLLQLLREVFLNSVRGQRTLDLNLLHWHKRRGSCRRRHKGWRLIKKWILL